MRLPGVLRGIGLEAKCEIIVRKSTSPGTSAYSEGFVLNAPPELPDGEYAVAFDHHTLRVTKERGLWLTSTAFERLI